VRTPQAVLIIKKIAYPSRRIADNYSWEDRQKCTKN
jgi:hypothetical protein